MKKILSLSLWGNNPKYTNGAIYNSEIAKTLYPGWVVRIYADKVAFDIVSDRLSALDNVELIMTKEAGDWNGMFWRFLPAFEEDVHIMISRDCDSRINQREKDAVDEWLLSDKDFHIMRDHPFHNIEILGGMWGCRNNVILKCGKDTINADLYESKWQIDQHFLRYEVYPNITDDIFVHDDYNHFPNESCVKPFPSPRIDNHFVGEIFDESNNRHPDHYTLL